MGNWFVRSRDLLQSLLPTLLQRFKQLPRDLSHRSELDTLHLRPSTGRRYLPLVWIARRQREVLRLQTCIDLTTSPSEHGRRNEKRQAVWPAV